jgi:hypothetical protein
VALRVEHSDHLAVHADRMRDRDGARDETLQVLRKVGLAGTGRAVQKHRPARVDGGAQQVDQPLRNDQVGKRGTHLLDRDGLVRDRLCSDALRVHLERHRRGADIRAARQPVGGACPAGLREVELHVGLVLAAARDLEQRFTPHELAHRFDHRAAQAELCAELGEPRQAELEHRLGDQLDEEGGAGRSLRSSAVRAAAWRGLRWRCARAPTEIERGSWCGPRDDRAEWPQQSGTGAERDGHGIRKPRGGGLQRREACALTGAEAQCPVGQHEAHVGERLAATPPASMNDHDSTPPASSV